MILGTGDIATALEDRSDITFFASGVSNSREYKDETFRRESNLLMEQERNIHLVYFSTLSIYYSKSPYVLHKLNMEYLVKTHFKTYTIVRLGNILWGSNENTLINYLKGKVSEHDTVLIHNTYRYLISKEEFKHWMKLIPVGIQNEMNITGKMVWVPDLFKDIQDGKY